MRRSVAFCSGGHVWNPRVCAGGRQSGIYLSGAVGSEWIALTGDADFHFQLFTESVGGAAVGLAEVLTEVPIIDGFFTVELPFDATSFDGQERWLQISVRSPAGGGPFTELSPRQRLSPTPYALYSLAPWTSELLGIAYTAGRVGIGTTSPVYALQVNTNELSRAVYGNNFADTAGTEYGVYGRATSIDGVGVIGIHDASSGVMPA